MSSAQRNAEPDASRAAAAGMSYGVVRRPDGALRPVARVGARVLDLSGCAAAGLLGAGAVPLFDTATLDAFLGAGPAVWRSVRARLIDLLTDPAARARLSEHLHPLDPVVAELPFTVADYVDFYASRRHAENVGRILRPDGDPLPPAWLHQPLGYHGRAGTVVVSGTSIGRPSGNRTEQDGSVRFGPSARLDFEAELGFVVGVGCPRERPVAAGDLTEHVFGVVLVNDWSARDIQAFETVPLGPFGGKSFATSISPWVVPLEALAAARVPPVVQDPIPAAYLRDDEPWSLDLTLEVRCNDAVITRAPFASMYWTPGQLLAALTCTGAGARTGDLFVSGTVSGPEPDQRGCLLELTWGGRDPVVLAEGQMRSWLADGDTVSITGWADGVDGTRIDLGEVTGTVHPAPE